MHVASIRERDLRLAPSLTTAASRPALPDLTVPKEASSRHPVQGGRSERLKARQRQGEPVRHVRPASCLTSPYLHHAASHVEPGSSSLSPKRPFVFRACRASFLEHKRALFAKNAPQVKTARPGKTRMPLIKRVHRVLNARKGFGRDRRTTTT